jgi:hypothetical protein
VRSLQQELQIIHLSEQGSTVAVLPYVVLSDSSLTRTHDGRVFIDSGERTFLVDVVNDAAVELTGAGVWDISPAFELVTANLRPFDVHALKGLTISPPLTKTTQGALLGMFRGFAHHSPWFVTTEGGTMLVRRVSETPDGGHAISESSVPGAHPTPLEGIFSPDDSWLLMHTGHSQWLSRLDTTGVPSTSQKIVERGTALFSPDSRFLALRHEHPFKVGLVALSNDRDLVEQRLELDANWAEVSFSPDSELVALYAPYGDVVVLVDTAALEHKRSITLECNDADDAQPDCPSIYSVWFQPAPPAER